MITEKEILIWANTLFVILEGKTSEEKGRILQKLIKIFKSRKKEHLLPRILKRLELIYLKRKNVELSFAREQPEDLVEEIKENIFKIFGRDKNIEIKINKDLIGGFRIKASNFLIEATIKDFLNELKSYY
jgi:F0F1-type ATP synthase delta subunit